MLSEEQIAVVESCGCDLHDDFVIFRGIVGNGDVFEWIIYLARLAVYFADGDSFDHIDL
jgi:hypothetical protein